MTEKEILDAALQLQNRKDFKGNDNSGKPKLDYLKKIVQMDDAQLFKEMKEKIWLSAYAANNPRSDYHFQCDATWDEGKRRGNEELYTRAHKQVSESI